MELNRQIYKSENDFTYHNQVIFNQKGLSEWYNSSNYKFNQDYNKMPDISFCYGMSKGEYSPFCNLKLIAINLNVNSNVTKIQIDDFKQKYAYMFANRQQSFIENSITVGAYGYINIATSYRDTRSLARSWGKGTNGDQNQAYYFYYKFRPAIKFNYAKICLCPEFDCYNSINECINQSGTTVRRKLSQLSSDYKYIAGINISNFGVYLGKQEIALEDRIDLCGINDIKVESYKSSGITGVDIELDNLTTPDISLNLM